MRVQCGQMLQVTLGALSTGYNNARPALLALMQNERVNTAVTNFSLIAIGAVGNAIANWLGVSSLVSDKGSFANV